MVVRPVTCPLPSSSPGDVSRGVNDAAFSGASNWLYMRVTAPARPRSRYITTLPARPQSPSQTVPSQPLSILLQQHLLRAHAFIHSVILTSVGDEPTFGLLVPKRRCARRRNRRTIGTDQASGDRAETDDEAAGVERVPRAGLRLSHRLRPGLDVPVRAEPVDGRAVEHGAGVRPDGRPLEHGAQRRARVLRLRPQALRHGRPRDGL